MRTSLCCVIGAAGLVAAGFVSPASADDLNSVVRNLNAVLNPGDAQRLEEQARRNRRADEERYWHNYRVGLEEQHRGGGAPSYRADEPRPSNRIGPEEARRLEEQARRNGRWEDERYWRNYGAGLEGPRPDRRGEAVSPYREGTQSSNRIGPEEAYRLEEQARRNGRWEDARYWAAYRAGLR